MTRQAISPRFATNTLAKFGGGCQAAAAAAVALAHRNDDDDGNNDDDEGNREQGGGNLRSKKSTIVDERINIPDINERTLAIFNLLSVSNECQQST
jgi:hypothetical protein